MAVRSKPKRAAPPADQREASSTVVGPAYTMPVSVLASFTASEEAPIDFEARQESISPTRRSPDSGLMPKVKRTSSKPAKARETKLKL